MLESRETLEARLAAATEVKSRIEALNALSRALAFSESGPAANFAREAIELCGQAEFTDQPYREGLAEAHFNRARACVQLSEYGEAMEALLAAAPLYDALGDRAGAMWVQNEFGRICYFLSDYPAALEHYLRVQELARELGNTNRQAGALHNIGLIHSSTGAPEEAVKCLSEGLRIGEAAGDRWVQAFLLGGLAEVSFHLRRYRDTLQYGRRSVALARELAIANLVHGSLLPVAWAHFELGEDQSAGTALDEALASALAAGDQRGRSEVRRAQGEQENRRGRHPEALALLGEALSLAEILGEQALVASCCLALTEAYRAQGDFAAALAHHERFHRADKQVFNEKSDLRLNTLHVIHRLEKMRRETELYQLHNASLQEEIEERRRIQDALEHHANHDSLTGRLNRRAFFARGEALRDACLASGHPLAALMLDVDHFKAINDRYGHQGGDDVLCAVAEIIAGGLRQTDLLGRYGGEEFAALLPELDAEGGRQIAERICALIAERRLQVDERALRITTSIGVAQIEPNESLDSLFSRADQALYAAKQGGRNRVEVWRRAG